MTTEQKKRKSRNAKEAFEEWGITRYPISKDNGEGLFYASNDEIFVRCIKFNKRWYVSNKGNVISFENPNRPKLLKPTDTNEKGRERYERGSDKKRIQIAQLVAESFDVYKFGNRRFIKYQVHHMRKYDISMGRAYNNNPEFLQYVSQLAHELLTYLQQHPKKKRTEEQEQHILEMLSKITELENPNKATIVIDADNEKAIYSEEQETVIKALKDDPVWPVINIVSIITLTEKRYKWCLERIKQAGYFERLSFISLTIYGQHRYYKIVDKEPQMASWKDFSSMDVWGSFAVIDNQGTILYVGY